MIVVIHYYISALYPLMLLKPCKQFLKSKGLAISETIGYPFSFHNTLNLKASSSHVYSQDKIIYFTEVFVTSHLYEATSVGT